MARWMDILSFTGRCIAVILLCGIILAAAPVYAQPADPGAEPTPVEFSSDIEDPFAQDVRTREDYLSMQDENLPSYGIMNIFVALALVIVIFWALFRFVVKPLMRGAMLGRGVEEFRIVASLPIAPTKSVQVIKLVDRLLVVGIAEGGMRLLSEITEPAEVSEMIKALDAKDPGKYHPFRKAFDTMLTRKDETGFEDKQKKFNTTLDSLKDKIQALKGSDRDRDQD
jgi:flagellar biogenesis protein FliO